MSPSRVSMTPLTVQSRATVSLPPVTGLVTSETQAEPEAIEPFFETLRPQAEA